MNLTKIMAFLQALVAQRVVLMPLFTLAGGGVAHLVTGHVVNDVSVQHAIDVSFLALGGILAAVGAVQDKTDRQVARNSKQIERGAAVSDVQNAVIDENAEQLNGVTPKGVTAAKVADRLPPAPPTERR